MLQTQDKLVKQFKSVSCQTETESVEFRSDLGDSDAEFLLMNNKNDMEAKSSLDVINDKLESVYQLLKGKSEHLTANSPKNIDVDFSELLNDGPATEKSQNLINSCQGNFRLFHTLTIPFTILHFNVFNFLYWKSELLTLN